MSSSVPQGASGNPLGVLCHAHGATEKVPLNLFEANVVYGIEMPFGILMLGTKMASKSRKGLR